MHLDRRRAERDRRNGGRVRAVFAVKSATPQLVQLGQAEDVGLAGMTLRRPRDVPFPIGTPVQLTFALPGTEQMIATAGAVISDRAAGPFRRTGIRFLALDPTDGDRIDGYCRDSVNRSLVRVAARAPRAERPGVAELSSRG